MSYVPDDFWDRVEHALDEIETTKPDTFDGVKAILDKDGDPMNAMPHKPDTAFFGGSGGDRQLLYSLNRAGWNTWWVKADYYFVVRHPKTKEMLTYVEGDVYRGDTAIKD